MQFLKKHYEKLILAAVVLAALGVVACLPILVSGERTRLEDLLNSFLPKHPKPLEPLDLNSEQVLLARAQSQVTLNFSGSNRVFNPVRWQMDKNSRIFPNPAGHEIELLQVTKLSPLYFIVSLDNVSVSPGLPTHYGISLTHEGALSPYQRGRKITYVPMNVTTNGFAVTNAAGPEEDPTSVTVQLSDPDQTVTLAKGEPFKRVEGYTVDLFYPPENHHFVPNRRVGDTISFAGELYKIIDIKESEVVLLQESNQKQWIKTFSLTTSTSTAPSPQF